MSILKTAQREAEGKILKNLKDKNRECFLVGHNISWVKSKKACIGYCKVCNKHFYEKY